MDELLEPCAAPHRYPAPSAVLTCPRRGRAALQADCPAVDQESDQDAAGGSRRRACLLRRVHLHILAVLPRARVGESIHRDWDAPPWHAQRACVIPAAGGEYVQQAESH